MPGKCPHIARLRAEHKQIGDRHIRPQRTLNDTYILADRKLSQVVVHDLMRHHILDFRQRLREKVISDRQVNRIIGALKTCFKEGVFRGELDRDAIQGVGNITPKPADRGVFASDGLRRQL